MELRSANQLSLRGPLSAFGANGHPWAGAGLFIVAGRGTGEFSSVTQFNSNAVTLEHPLPVVPDQSSIVTIVPMQENYLMIGNTFSDSGVAVQLFGTSVNHVIAGNTSVRTGGFLDKGLVYGHFQPSWYNQILNNKIVEGNLYNPGGGQLEPAGAAIGAYGYQQRSGMPPLTRGIIIRGNDLENNARIEVYGGKISNTPGITDIVAENNRVANSDDGIVVNGGATNVLLKKQSFRTCGKRDFGCAILSHTMKPWHLIRSQGRVYRMHPVTVALLVV